MKIGLIVPGFSADERDWCIPALLDLVRTLAVEHSVHVFALEYPYYRAVYSVYGATVHSMGGRNRGRRYAPRLWFDALAAIYAEQRRTPFDLLHAFWANEPGLMATLAGRTLKIPVIVSVAGGELVGLSHISYGGQLRLIERTMIRTAMRAADRVTVGSPYLRRLAARWRSDASVLPLGVDVQRFSPGESRKLGSSPALLNVGSLVPVKNQMQLLKALALLESRDACLEIIGSGDLESELRHQTNVLGIADRVTFAGALAHDALPSRYRMADVVVQSSLHEAQGMAVLEATACGIPVAGTPVGIVPELAAAGGAVAARGFGSNDLAEAITAAIAARDELGPSARQSAEQQFSLEATWNGWMELYRQAQRA